MFNINMLLYFISITSWLSVPNDCMLKNSWIHDLIALNGTEAFFNRTNWQEEFCFYHHDVIEIQQPTVSSFILLSRVVLISFASLTKWFQLESTCLESSLLLHYILFWHTRTGAYFAVQIEIHVFRNCPIKSKVEMAEDQYGAVQTLYNQNIGFLKSSPLYSQKVINS